MKATVWVITIKREGKFEKSGVCSSEDSWLSRSWQYKACYCCVAEKYRADMCYEFLRINY